MAPGRTHNRSNVDDAPRSLLSQEREHCLRHSQNSKKVGIKELLRFFDPRLFERANEGIAGVVDQGIDSTGPIKNRPHAGMHRLLVANVNVNQLHFLQRSLRTGISPGGSEDPKAVAWN
jgi:hypothetical protein